MSKNNLIHEVSSANFHVKAPKQVQTYAVEPKAQTLTVAPTFTSIDTLTGCVGQMSKGDFETHLETLLPSACTHTFHNQDYARAIVVVQGSGYAVISKISDGEDDIKHTSLRQGSIIVVPVDHQYRLYTADDSMTVAYVSDTHYEETVEIIGNTEKAASRVLPTRRDLPDQTKTRQALLAEANNRNSLTNRTLEGEVIRPGDNFDLTAIPQGDNIKPLKFVDFD